MELVKANTELRYKATDYENQVKEHKDKIRDQKKKLEYLHRSKKDLEENSEKAKHAALRRKTDWTASNRDNVSEWGDMSIREMLFK
jgi:peptidoglycan hydrolase CwlO-like protein